MEKVCRLSKFKFDPDLDSSKQVFDDKGKFREISSESTRNSSAVPPSSCIVEPLNAAQWSEAGTVPICTHRLNRLLIAEEYRQDIVGAGIGNNPRHPWPPMIEDDLPGLGLHSDVIASTDLNLMRGGENSAGPSPSDILTALTHSSAQDIVNSERFKVIGDSFLKMAVVLHLFSRRDIPEGGLDVKRKRLVSNANLISLGKLKKIHEAVESRFFSLEESFCPPGVQCPDDKERRKMQTQKFRSKICADAVVAVIGVYVERSGLVGGLHFLRFLGLPLGSEDSGPFLRRFDLSYDPLVADCGAAVEDVLQKHLDEMGRVERILGYKFRNCLYLLEALTHRSYRGNPITRSYERLEFLGDAVVDFLVCRFILTNNPRLSPGQMISVRSALVSNDRFAQITVNTKLANGLLNNAPSISEALARFEKLSSSQVLDLTDFPKPFSDLMESLMGAVFVDSGLDFSATWDVFRRLVSDQVLVETLTRDARIPMVVLHETYHVFTESRLFAKMGRLK